VDKKFFYEKEIRAEFATYNPYLKNDIEQVRMALGIPKGGFSTPEEADKWYNEHYQRTKGKPRQPAHPWNWHLPKELAGMLDSFSYSDQPSRINFDSDVPLDRYAMKLIYKFGLPEEMVPSLKGYILKEKDNALAIPSGLQEMYVPIDEGEEGTKYIPLLPD